MPFTTRLLVRFNHADSAGVMFYGNLYFLAHQVFEEFVTAAGFGWDEWFENPRWLVPIRRVEADYLKPKRPGRELEGRLWVEQIRETSFSFRVRFYDDTGDLSSDLKMVVVFTDRVTEKKIPIPPEVRARLEAHLDPAPPREEP